MAEPSDAMDGQNSDPITLRTRDSSPSPSLSPTPALSSRPSSDRTFSTGSSVSNISGDRSSSISVSSRRRGYIRPQGAEFAESARHRDSVMSLGSIAHLQYYFARTGLLDGKGGRMAGTKKKGESDVPRLTLTQQAQLGGDLTESPIEEVDDPTDAWDENEPMMLPPTVSTYSVRTYHLPPPPDLEVLRKDLQSALDKAQHVLSLTKDELATHCLKTTPNVRSPDGLEEEEDRGKAPPPKTQQGWWELEGMRILDLVTLAIRAARIYYTSHENPERLASIKTEKQIRADLIAVLDGLKRFAYRNFTGGVNNEERATILGWIKGINEMIDTERRLEEADVQRRRSWVWASGDWSNRERERGRAFLQSLESPDQQVPTWESPDSNALPTKFLSRLQDGRVLVRLHNAAVRASRRRFGEIKRFHDDVNKPYRMADNLRYWAKAAEIRWEVKLDVDVMGVVNGDNDEAWKKLDQALLRWCQGVREELIHDWHQTDANSTRASIPADENVL